MNNHLARHVTTLRLFLALALAASIAMPLPARSASVALATAPLQTSTTSSVKPNVMFILDDSGSMDWDYLPDWANDADPFTGNSYVTENYLHKNNGFNGVAYNPAITYLKPVLFNTDGTLNVTTYPDMLSPWTAVRRDGFGIQSIATDNLVGNASYYVFVFGEYCTSAKLTNCIAATAPTTVGTTAYDKPAKLRWCNTAALTNCQSINSTTYKYPRYPGLQFPATATLTVNGGGTATSIKVNGLQILSGSTTSSTSTSTVASRIVTKINNCTAAISGSCTIAGYSASRSGNVVTIIAPVALGAITFTPVIAGTMTATVTAFSGGGSVPGSNLLTNVVSTNNIYPYPGTTTKAATRTDCAGTTCTYAEEMNNYANWWAYYHTRMQSMKTATSRAFKDLTNKFRVGFTTIGDTTATDGPLFLGVNPFELTQKNTWYTRLLATSPSGSTPLRAALSKAGRYYGNKVTGQSDPVQYSCQQNFTILSTDGYWNTGLESPSSTTCTNNTTASTNYGPFGLDNQTCVGNLDDPATTTPPMADAASSISNTLADVGKYFYETDLRTSTLANCTGGISTDFPTGNPDVCTNNVFVSPSDNNTNQHMTTFTMGLGADGTLNYESGYATATSGDFYDLKNALGTPTVKWSNPIANAGLERIDDLWHAAVDGRGTYFSAKNPDEMVKSLTTTLSSITAKIGAGAAAATSTLNPVPGNNYAYVASYTSVLWKGNLESRSINTVTGKVSDAATWCVENISAGTCAAPGAIVTDTNGSSIVYNCVVPGATALTCTTPGVFDSVALTCTTEIPKACTGTMGTLVSASADTRTIYTANDTGNALTAFDATYAAAHSSYFDATHISGLSQWAALSTTQQTAAAGANLINFLRGQNGYEDRAANTDKLYRFREAVLGDALESKPAFLANPVFSYPYPGYSAFLATYASRPGTVYMGTNDGMMHAFAADTGIERWAYVPSMVITNMWHLADKNYSNNHVNFVNGDAITTDICAANCTDNATAAWKTILVGGLNGGGRGYYALDITDPTTPTLLWEFTTSAGIGIQKDDDLGYTFGQPVVTRKTDGTWVVLVTSGYNNTVPGSGIGYLYVLNANTGAIISKISTGVGDTTTPSGLAKIAAWNNDSGGNLAGFVYGGDLLGNLWRFDINSATAATIGTGDKFLLSTLFSDLAATSPQSITTTPVLSEIGGKRVIFIGTGKYLEQGDLSTTQRQTQYAIKDDDATVTLVNPRNSTTNTGANLMVQQTLTNNPDGTATRVSSTNPVSFATQRGWYIDLPDGGTATAGAERVNVDARLFSGTLLFPTIVPSSTVCSPGGWGWLNAIDYATGTAIAGAAPNASWKYDSPIVGTFVIYIGGKAFVEVVTASDPNPVKDDRIPGGNTPIPGEFSGVRVLWHEIIQ